MSLSVSGHEEVQWKERKFTMGSVSGYQEEHWKERKFTMDSVSEVVSEIELKIIKFTPLSVSGNEKTQ